MTPRKIVYVDMDNTLVDFGAGLALVDEDAKARYAGDEDEIPGIFSLMPPLPGAVDGFVALSAVFDVYILSTAPWNNSTAWQHKVEWVREHIGSESGTPAYKRLILSHHKHLNRGDYLIDDRPWANGADRFDGEVIAFGSPEYPDWHAVTEYLLEKAQAVVTHRIARRRTPFFPSGPRKSMDSGCRASGQVPTVDS